MSLWMEISFLKQVAYRLDRFAIKKDGQDFLANCRCHVCGDSQKKANKKRGYFYQHDGHIFYKCWNCGISYSFSNFLKEFDPATWNAFRMECYREKAGRFEPEPPTPPSDDLLKTKISDILVRAKEAELFDGCPLVVDLEDGHPAKVYLMGRKLPNKHLNMFYYVESFFKWSKGNTDKFSQSYFGEMKDHPRIVFPWKTQDGVTFAYQARAIHGQEPKYYTIILDETHQKVFGVDRVDPTKPVYVFEGPLDSLFIPNAVAVGSSALMNYDGDIYCFDNEKRNREIVNIMEKAVESGRKVFIPPDNYKWKDVNDAVKEGGMTAEDVLGIINDNTFSGLSAKLRFSQWKKRR
jgi:hypothetical protein